MSRSAVRRIVEAFFHGWPVYLVLVSMAIGFGMLRVRSATADYLSIGSVLVDSDSLVTTQSGIDPNDVPSYQTGAQFTAQEMVGLMASDGFMDSVLVKAEIELSTDPGERAAERRKARRQLSVVPMSGRIIQVIATSPEPERSARLAQGLIDQFIAFKIQADLAESGASEEFFSGILDPYVEELEAAQAAVDALVLEIDAEQRAAMEESGGRVPDLTAAQELRLERVKQEEIQANERYQAALASVESSQLAELQTETNIRQSYTVLDRPEAPELATGRLFYDIISLTMFAAVGLLLALIAPVISATSNTTLVFADDLDVSLPVGVIATVPAIRRSRLDIRKIPDEPPRMPPSETIEPEREPAVVGAAGPVDGAGGETTTP